jgi:hypothetical protein
MDCPSEHVGTGAPSTNDASRVPPSAFGGQHGPPSAPHFGGAGRQRGAPRRVSPGDAQYAPGAHRSASPEQPSLAAAPPQGRHSLPQSACDSLRQVPISWGLAVPFGSAASFW